MPKLQGVLCKLFLSSTSRQAGTCVCSPASSIFRRGDGRHRPRPQARIIPAWSPSSFSSSLARSLPLSPRARTRNPNPSFSDSASSPALEVSPSETVMPRRSASTPSTFPPKHGSQEARNRPNRRRLSPPRRGTRRRRCSGDHLVKAPPL